MNLFDIFRKQPVAPPVPKRPEPAIFRATGLDIRAEQWRSTPNLVSTAHRIVNDVGFIQMLEVLRTESPANLAFSDIEESLPSRAVQQAKTEGYNLALNLMLSLAKPLADAQMPEATYEPEPNPNP